jgi:hypothetical protein
MHIEIDETYGTFTLRNPITNPRLRRLCRKLDDDCGGSDEYVAVIRKIARTRDPQAIEVLAALLDSPGPLGRAAVKGLVGFGEAAVFEMMRVLRDSVDADALEHASQVLSEIRARAPRHAA